MADSVVQIGARMDSRLVEQIDVTAREDFRDRTSQLEYLTSIGLAGRRRLKELERLAIETITTSTDPATTAASDHLAEHRTMSGIPTEKVNV